MPQQRYSRSALEAAPPPQQMGAPAPARRRISRRALDAAPPPPPASEQGGWFPTAVRVASGFVPGGPLGAITGAAGEYAAQRAEGRDDTNWWQVGTQGALGLIPFKAAAKGGYQALRSMLRGGGIGSVMSTGAEAADQIDRGDLDVGRLGVAAGMGAGLGTAGGGIAHMIGNRGARVPAKPPAEVVFNDQTVAPRTIRPSGTPPPPQSPRAATPPNAYTPRRPYPLVSDPAQPPRIPRAAVMDAPPPPPVTPAAGVGPMRIGSGEHAEAVMERIRAQRGRPRPFPRGTDPDLIFGRSADIPSVPAARSLGGEAQPGAASTVSSDVAASRPPDSSTAPVRDFLAQFDAPITDAERAAARAGTPPPARPSPAARRRARRQKLEANRAAAGATETGGKPRYTAEQVAAHRRAAGYDAMLDPEDQRFYVPTPEQAARRFPSLPESDLRTLLERYAFRRAEAGAMPPEKIAEHPSRSYRESFDEYVRRHKKLPDNGTLVGDDMYARAEPDLRPIVGGTPSRGALPTSAAAPPTREARFRTLTDPMSERGEIDPELLYTLGSTAAGSAVGTGVGAAFDADPKRGAAGGAVLGAIAGAGARHPNLLNQLQYFNFLSAPSSIAKGWAGATGGVLVDALERGDLPRVLRETARPETAKSLVRGFVEGGTPGRSRPEGIDPGSVYNPLTWPGRLFAATDEAGGDVLTRAGRTEDEARQALLTSEPKSEISKGFQGFRNAHLGARLATPFYRTLANLVERGIERTPGVGYLPTVRSWTGADLPTATRKQGVGALAALGGYALGEKAGASPEDSWWRTAGTFAPIAAGPAAMLSIAAQAAGRKVGGADADAAPGATREAGLASFGRELGQGIPAPDPMDLLSLKNLLRRLTPSGGRVLSEAMGTDPKTLDTGESLTAPAVSRLPWLNELILDPKRARRRAVPSSSRRRRPSRGGR